ncbi:HET-domain-containing protein [Tothia fuscella]|uniref:HET-domain-containing protein n=1 Tax=Tothia fuscella TaxID=1048955 RepID=A0A9P4NLL8_9PEZI|nr:HET-domain-containing protein [Tothia fuscella]
MQNTDSITVCATCSKINLHHILKQGETSGPLQWLLPFIRDQACQLCNLICWIVDQTDANKNIIHGKVVGRPRRVDESQFALSFKIVELDSVEPVESPYILLPLASGYSTLEQGFKVVSRAVPTSSLDVALVKQWLSTCDSRHGVECSMGSGIKPSTTRFRLIDVEDLCVVPAPALCRYTALSYVWGNVEQPTLTSDNIRAWEMPGALRYVTIPRTIKDAMQVCRLLNLKYLWVDSLCIVQNIAEEVNKQVAHMDFIYRRAYLTMIIADGEDCDTGISTLQPRESAQKIATISDLTVGTSYLSVKKELLRSKWASRAWTLQEYALSFRSLIFTKRQVLFSCAEGVLREDVNGYLIKNLPRPDRYLLPIALDFFLSNRLPSDVLTNVYLPLLKSFSSRQTTYSSDVLKAFSGIFGALKPQLGEFRWGIPEMYMAHGISWSYQGPMRRRPSFPSWSWAGWELLLNDNAAESGLNHILQHDDRMSCHTWATWTVKKDYWPNHDNPGWSQQRWSDREVWREWEKGNGGSRSYSSDSAELKLLKEILGMLTIGAHDILRPERLSDTHLEQIISFGTCIASIDIKRFKISQLNLQQPAASNPGQINSSAATSFTTSEEKRRSKFRRLLSPADEDKKRDSYRLTDGKTVSLRPPPPPPARVQIEFILIAVTPPNVVIMPVKWEGAVVYRIGNPQSLDEAEWFKLRPRPCIAHLA